jgi:hypothetical protein
MRNKVIDPVSQLSLEFYSQQSRLRDAAWSLSRNDVVTCYTAGRWQAAVRRG